MRTLDETRTEGVRLLRKYLRSPEEQRTPILRSLAETFVDARAHFERPDGSPDWKGRSYAYRVFVRDVYTEAGVAKDDQASLQASARYHVGTVLRERLDEDTLTDYDLISRSPKERSHDRRTSRSALLSALTAKDLHGGALMAITAAYTVLTKMDLDAVDELDGEGAEFAEKSLAELERRVKQLRKRIAARQLTPG